MCFEHGLNTAGLFERFRRPFAHCFDPVGIFPVRETNTGALVSLGRVARLHKITIASFRERVLSCNCFINTVILWGGIRFYFVIVL